MEPILKEADKIIDKFVDSGHIYDEETDKVRRAFKRLIRKAYKQGCQDCY